MSLGTGSKQTFAHVSRIVLLMLPGVLLLGASLRAEPESRYLLWLGAALQAVLCCFFLMTGRIGQGHAVIILYLLGLCWTWLAEAQTNDWYSHLAQCVLLIVPLLFFAVQ